MRIVQAVSLGAIAISLVSNPAQAQSSTAPAEQDAETTAPAATGPQEIIVTARKRDETLISVPVVVTAVGGEQLASQGVTNLDGIARITPQLMVGNQGGSVQGGNINIRGIEGPDQNPFGDSAVSFNIDGVQVTKATVRRMSDFDMAQVEVLKGPQALFYGKNSPAGIISIHTADPTDVFEAKLSAGYEFNADQLRLEGYVSSPLTDSIGVRLAGVYSDMKGDLKDLTPKDSPYYNGSRNPNSEDWALRGTLKFDDGGPFDAKLKLSYGELKGNGPASTTAFVSCPYGARFSTFLGGTIDQCSASDGANSNAGYGTVLADIGGDISLFRPDGKNFNNQDQFLGGLEMNYELGAVTLTSVTGYYKVDVDQCQNYENDDTVLLPSCNVLGIDEFSQELRFNTDYDGPLNVSGGVYFADTSASTGSITYLFGGNFDLIAEGFGGPETPALINNYFFKQKGKAYSAYMQVSFEPIDTIEIDVGGRYTREEKRLPLVLSGGGLSDGVIPGTTYFDESLVILTQAELDAAGNPDSYNLGVLKTRKGAWTDFSPEVTVSYRPNRDLTVFGSYKHGFLSGGFNSGSVTFAPPSGVLDLSYNPQTVKGFEAGLKANLLNGDVRFNLAAYSYTINDQQVTVVFNATNSIRNAGASKVKGIEADVTYRTPLDGLSLNAAAAYNDGKYSEYANAPCYGGQTAELGCRADGTQDLSGTELIRAPDWNLQAGFDYKAEVTDGLELGINGGVKYVSSYLTDASSAPNGRQPGYTLVNGTIRLTPPDESWELALIGRNLTDKYYFVASSLVPFAFDPTGTGTTLDRFASLSRGREVMLRLSYRFGG
ncbi:TonB-dependent receptor [Croceicoccus mobilis]|uniref:TonB-dependent receptor n=1 Tax=Croceicoccus mobilis TaxID=1703339 RepID=A0A917DYQ8_9SPHN|nr:TonB-dependent receptor [Croceicoccus mobilis]GGD80295.1 TonB-dependent receptor [Croceicoccus mobilis]